MPKSQKGSPIMYQKLYHVPPIYYLPLQYAVSLINQGHSADQAAQSAIDRFAYYGKHQNKRLKDFDKSQFKKHLNRFTSIPNAILVRKSPKHR